MSKIKNKILYFLSSKIHRVYVSICMENGEHTLVFRWQGRRGRTGAMLLWNTSMKPLDRKTTSYWTLKEDSLQITPMNSDLGSLGPSLQNLWILFWGEMRNYSYWTFRGKLASTLRDLSLSMIYLPKKSDTSHTAKFLSLPSSRFSMGLPMKSQIKACLHFIHNPLDCLSFLHDSWFYQIFIENVYWNKQLNSHLGE